MVEDVYGKGPAEEAKKNHDTYLERVAEALEGR